MSTVRLPDIPTGPYLEDYVAAYLQCGGFYTEKSLIESGETQVMELDIIAWQPDDQPPKHALFEVKGGNWGFSDVFKVFGWKRYLESRGVDSAYLVAPIASKTETVVAFMRDKCDEIGLNLIAHSDQESLESNLQNHGLTPSVPNELDNNIWRFSFWLERQIQRVVSDRRRSPDGLTGPGVVYNYQELIRNGLVHARDVRERLAILYNAHFEHQTLARSIAAELDGVGWIPQDPPGGDRWNEALFQCKHPLVHAAMYYEHRARLDILKGAVEFALLKKHNALPPERKIKLLGIELPADHLPQNFHNAVRALPRIEGFAKIPVLWQSLLWKWGGFFLTNSEAEEKSALAEEVGLTVEAVDAAIDIYGTLFPISGGWFQDLQGTKILKLFPCQFRGIGARYRLWRVRTNDFSDVIGSSPPQYLQNNLARWNNSTLSLLKYGSGSAGA